MSSIQVMDGSILVSKATIIRLLQCVRPARLDKDATLFQCGMEEQKKIIADVMKKEFKLSTGFNEANDLIANLK